MQEIARLLHAHGAYACFDFAASAPYVEIDMNPPARPGDGDASLDAVFISPHKFLGGPGSSGVLVFNERLYNRELPPSVGGGGTVAYVSPVDQDFIADIEERETRRHAGRAADAQGRAGARAQEPHRRGAHRGPRAGTASAGRSQRWCANERIELLGNPDPRRRIGIVSFNLRDPRGRYLHPKFVTVLLNDLFGIQSRAGCSCAGPYGHRLLGIDQPTSELYRDWVRKGFQGIKPGWCRVGFHYAMDDLEAAFVMDAVEFIAEQGYRFLPLYRSTAAPACGAIASTARRMPHFRSMPPSRRPVATRPRCRRRPARGTMPSAWPRRAPGPSGSVSRARRPRGRTWSSSGS